MEEKYIRMLREALFDKKICRDEFNKFDLPHLREMTEPFVWVCHSCGTILQELGVTQIQKVYKNSVARFQMFRDDECLISTLKYWINSLYCQEYVMFYWDGHSLLSLKDEAELKGLYHNLFDSYIRQMESVYAEEKATANKELEIKFYSDETKKDFDEACTYAESIGDKTLLGCIQRLQSTPRMSIKHEVFLSQSAYPDSFEFAERLNGVCRLCGGIYFDPQTSAWSIHT